MYDVVWCFMHGHEVEVVDDNLYHGNPQPSFLWVITHIWGVSNRHFSWF